MHVLEMERLSLIQPAPPALEPNGTVSALRETIEKLLQEVREQQLKGLVYLYRCHSTLWHDYSEPTDPIVIRSQVPPVAQDERAITRLALNMVV